MLNKGFGSDNIPYQGILPLFLILHDFLINFDKLSFLSNTGMTVNKLGIMSLLPKEHTSTNDAEGTLSLKIKPSSF